VRDLEKMVNDLGFTSVFSRLPTPKPDQSLELRNFTRALEIKFGGRVMINGSDRRGKIIIEYDSQDDLERIMRILK